MSATGPLADSCPTERSGVDQIDRTKKIHLTDIDAVVAEDGVGHRDVKKGVGEAEVALLFLGAGLVGILYYGNLFQRRPPPVALQVAALPSLLLAPANYGKAAVKPAD
jgi:hypothetical protein